MVAHSAPTAPAPMITIGDLTEQERAVGGDHPGQVDPGDRQQAQSSRWL